MDYIFFIIAILMLFIIVKFLSWPIKILIKLLINGVFGIVLLFLVNLIGFHIGINATTALIAGFFGVPGVIFLIIFKIFL